VLARIKSNLKQKTKEKQSIMKKTLLTLLAAVAVAGFGSQAKAAATVTISDGITATNVVIDNQPQDFAPGTGIELVVANVGVWNVIIGGVTKPVFGTATSPVMDLNIQARSSAAGTLTVTFSDNNFGATGPETGLLKAIVTGTQVSGASSTVDFKVYGDSGNVVGAQTSLATSTGAQSWPPVNTTASGSVALSAPFSLTEVVVINTGGATVLDLDASFQLTIDQTEGPLGCRVTGGSNKQTNTYQAACITTTPPTFVSHGGQLGAPYSAETAFTPYSPCISGEWEHNRHLTKNSLVGVLHASGNGNVHQFDSHLCACLPCPENPGAVGVVGGFCNPGDRICGPEPRRAPANKICFSGVGDYTTSNGQKTLKAVFRVDIEDRGEGNSHVSPLPLDRYRIRIWVLDPACGRPSDPDSAAGLAIRYAASADPTKIAVLATTEDLKVNIPPDIDDGGDMTQGNHQIHPQTGATCP
jgi:hypothetical protein